MEIQTLFGLPAHPLVVHAAVVLLPLAALVTIVAALWSRGRRVLAIVALCGALVATAAVGLSQGSGEYLGDRVRETALTEAHTEQGETVLPWAIALVVAAGAVVVVGELRRRRIDGPASHKAVAPVLVALAVVAGVGATWKVIEVGHSGAKAVWTDRVDSGSGGSSAPER